MEGREVENQGVVESQRERASVSRVDAREMTRQINEATDLLRRESDQELSDERKAEEINNRETAREIGGLALGQVLTRDQVDDYVGDVTASGAEVVNAMAETDGGYAQNFAEALKNNEEGVIEVGDESQTEVEEREQAQEENLRNEISPKRDKDAKIVAKSQEEHGRQAERMVDEFLKQKQFSPAELTLRYKEERARSLLDLENPYILGQGNVDIRRGKKW